MVFDRNETLYFKLPSGASTEAWSAQTTGWKLVFPKKTK